ncbi:MAG: hypothetical protein ACI9T7_001159, partial [Oleiphilaceae bacterium]
KFAEKAHPPYEINSKTGIKALPNKYDSCTMS